MILAFPTVGNAFLTVGNDLTTANVNRDEQGFDRYLAVQGWLDNIL